MYANNYPPVENSDAFKVLKDKKHPHNTEICQTEMLALLRTIQF